MRRRELLDLLTRHETRFMEEAGYVKRARAFVESNADCFHRDHWPAHVTGSAWVVSPDRSRVLMMHRRKLNQWFQPGGHADGDADILRVALRETAEETGLEARQVRLLHMEVFDVDVHSIAASEHDPQHEHIDIRFLVEIDDSLPVPGNDEAHEVLWVRLNDDSAYWKRTTRSGYRRIDIMQSGHSCASVVKLHYLYELERHIENTLSDHWILRVEHSEDVNLVRTQWQQWGKALYCVKEARPVIRSIQACRARYPTHSVRLYAEKASPRTRFIYPVDRPEGSTGSAQVLPGKWMPQASRFGAWLKPLDTGAIAARNRLWRIITVTGMLLGSMLAFEEVIA